MTCLASLTPGPNAPMFDACKNSTQPDASAVGAYESWTASDFPPSKLVLGLPTYGYISRSFANGLRTRRLEPSANVTKVINSDGDSEGQISFRELVQQGVLAANADPLTGKVNFVGSGGFEREWDGCSCTPFLRSASAGQVVSYDDPRSLRMKAEFAQRSGMLGVNLFDIPGDTDGWDLTAAVADVFLSDRTVL
jgi:chitinase